MKSTSYKSFVEMVESGELTKKQIEVANAFRKSGPMTGRQVTSIIYGAWKRLKELEDCGILHVVGTTKDYTTGKIVSVWEFNDNQGILIPPPVTKKKTPLSVNQLSKIFDAGYAEGIRGALAHIGYPIQEIESIVDTILDNVV